MKINPEFNVKKMAENFLAEVKLHKIGPWHVEPRLPDELPLLKVLGRRDDGEHEECGLLLEPVKPAQKF
jgi:hypothetical protein